MTSVLLAFAVLFATSGCHVLEQTKEADKPSEYAFLVGPDPKFTEGVDRRSVVTIPSRYVILPEGADGNSLVPVGQVNFAIQFPDGAPVPPDRLAPANVVIVTTTWGEPGGVKRRTDGTYLNHYSRYGAPAGSEFGMNVYRTTDGSDESRLFVSEDQNTIIECVKRFNVRPQGCRLISDRGSYLTAEAYFDVSLLPQWQEVFDLSRRTITSVKPPQGDVSVK